MVLLVLASALLLSDRCWWGKPGLFPASRTPEALKALAPGSQPPFLICNEEVKTDISKIEEFLEETLAPPQWVDCIRFIQTHWWLLNTLVYLVFFSSLKRIDYSTCFSLNGRFPKLCCRYKESNGTGEDIFRKFSAYIKNSDPRKNGGEGVSSKMDLLKLFFFICRRF